MLKKLECNASEFQDKLVMPARFSLQLKDEYESGLEQLPRDIERTTLVDYSPNTFESFSEQVKAHRPFVSNYTQGDLDAGYGVIVHLGLLHQQPIDLNLSETDTAEYIVNNYPAAQKAFRIAYRNNAGILCGVCLTYNRNNPNQWILMVQEDYLQHPTMRTSVLFSKGMLDSNPAASSVDKINFNTIITEPRVAYIVQDLFNSDYSININNYQKWNECLQISKKNSPKIIIPGFLQHNRFTLPMMILGYGLPLLIGLGVLGPIGWTLAGLALVTIVVGVIANVLLIKNVVADEKLTKELDTFPSFEEGEEKAEQSQLETTLTKAFFDTRPSSLTTKSPTTPSVGVVLPSPENMEPDSESVDEPTNKPK